jgi:hypothetical protein
MMPGRNGTSSAALISWFVLCASGAFAQAGPAWIDPPGPLPLPQGASPNAQAQTEPVPTRAEPLPDSGAAQVLPHDPASTASTSPVSSEDELVELSASDQRGPQLASLSNRLAGKRRAARDLASAYLDRWSAPNPVALAAAPSFYGSKVTFHGRERDLDSVLAEKRRFSERWPDRDYRHRPETTQVSCDADGVHCTVWSIFDYSARNPRFGRRASGIGAHELVVSFAGGTPIIQSEDSRVLSHRNRNR